MRSYEFRVKKVLVTENERTEYLNRSRKFSSIHDVSIADVQRRSKKYQLFEKDNSTDHNSVNESINDKGQECYYCEVCDVLVDRKGKDHGKLAFEHHMRRPK